MDIYGMVLHGYAQVLQRHRAAVRGIRMNCMFCGKETAESREYHKACDAELRRRCDAYLCSFCGKHERDAGGACSVCRSTRLVFVGYPGGA